ncbi:hypothetical protein [Quadrisphaera setariae]|uniref:Shikimate kinase n=1 Tax=Quadrisphaera setariae TaxID=2593304 RepID=A0A5C8ZKD8_9ACTN|nr:hypothetical protein [Quadrisphaera setariae]TXR57593.1 hypothetical protein FMM08_05085 [Quadrisphaera setariae]
MSADAAVVFMLGYPGTGTRTVGGHVAAQLGGVLVDNALINRPVLEVLQWDGVAPLPEGVWDRVVPIRDAVLGAVEDLAPPSTSFVFTNVLEDEPSAAPAYERIRSLAHRRGSLFLAVMIECDVDAQVSRIDTPDRIALRKGSDPEGYRGHRLTTRLFQPPAGDLLTIDTTTTTPADNAARIVSELRNRGLRDRRSGR